MAGSGKPNLFTRLVDKQKASETLAPEQFGRHTLTESVFQMTPSPLLNNAKSDAKPQVLVFLE
jgi:hypothetical protein